MTAYGYAMVALVAKTDAEAIYRQSGGHPNWDDWVEAERLYDIAFEAQEYTTRKAFDEVNQWLCGKIETLPKPKKGRAA